MNKTVNLSQNAKIKVVNYLRIVRAPVIRFFKPLSKYVLLKRGRQLEPLSEKYGFDRGMPIDRYYIEKFLQKNSNLINGKCLEIHDNYYTEKFGADRVTKSCVLDINKNNNIATHFGNLKNVPHITDNSFDCIILTHTLGMIDDSHAAIRECYRILRPGGHLLFTSKAMGPATLIRKGALVCSIQVSNASTNFIRLFVSVMTASSSVSRTTMPLPPLRKKCFLAMGCLRSLPA